MQVKEDPRLSLYLRGGSATVFEAGECPGQVWF